MEKKFNDYRVQVKIHYSDEQGQAVEQSVLIKPGTNYSDFIKSCAKMYEVIAHTYGADFEEANKHLEQKESEVATEAQ